MIGQQEHLLRRWLEAVRPVYTPGQFLALSIIAEEANERRRCTLGHREIARRAGVGVSTVRTAIDVAIDAQHITIAYRSDTGQSNIIRLLPLDGSGQ
ncbi:hypothetical protein [Pararhizobium sp.]|uniref:hypothetical protein n=1 Tax=Pararhizobium sp. TaxID=1977563 RepID=UPI0027193659|nr:hypothetical protein [Pararhizobium sp.]MDO9417960.1 hypothetical protein [Pararhizobium sp.]